MVVYLMHMDEKLKEPSSSYLAIESVVHEKVKLKLVSTTHHPLK